MDSIDEQEIKLALRSGLNQCQLVPIGRARKGIDFGGGNIPVPTMNIYQQVAYFQR